ncbi:putative ubiquitin-protein ligase [Leptomonas pyrrhocoris]|uniref:Putative ubiquitin-protein ligase n=1 Tax=Leptomonas pyrrhocoris TaxID=157538 RepID=A0A0N0VFP4_LEPPY|nr:putative ubiquitin-protein ligase [Leptomonas pyrrhocoris]KPA81804.1 putative ubiquitin-protein ligase [Leptomonas pyrrhocoris]|eukprot:XP_015660243.1 putative ubiquitin-protein ligase [Leptomonas pyrrhocoris]
MEDWGMLSVADVIDGDVDSDDTTADTFNGDVSTEYDVAGAPLFLLDAAFAPELQRAMLSSVKYRLSAHSTRIERVFAARFRKLKVSLSSSRRIRQRLSETIALMGVSLPEKSEHTSLLSTIALLGALTNREEAGAYASVLLDSLAHVNWELASPQSCHELFGMVEMHSSDGVLNDGTKAAVARAKHDLALRSGRLSLLLNCLLAQDSTLELGPEVLPCTTPSRCVCVSATTTASFLVKTLVLPAHFRIKDTLRCFFSDRTARFLGNTHVAHFEAMGTMETRFLQRGTEPLPGGRGDVVLYVSPTCVLRIKAIGRDEQYWHFSTHLHDNTAKEKVHHGRLALRTAGLPFSEVRFHFCISEAISLCCMVSSHPPQRTRGSIYVGEVAISALHNATRKDEFATMELKPLLRSPVLHCGSGQHKAFHFTKSVSVSIGRVTLKELFHPFCVEMWVFPRSVDKDQTFLSIGDKGVDEVLLGLELVGNGVRWRGGARTPRLGSSFATFTSPGKLVVVERWWHVALNFDGATWELWLDHELVSRQPALVSPQAIADAKCVVGKSFIGMAAEVRVWQHTRTSAQLIRDARRPLSGTEDGLCGYFPFNEGHGNVIMDYAPHHEHALLPFGEPYWCAVDTVPVLADPRSVLYVADFVPLAWIEEADEVFFAASSESYTVAGVRSDHTLCVFDYACDDHRLVSQRTVELPSEWTIKSVSSHATRASLVCCAVVAKPTAAVGAAEASAAVQVCLWEMWAYVGYVEATQPVPYTSTWSWGKAVLTRSARHAQRYLTAVQFLTDHSSWAASVPPFVLDQDDEVLMLLLRLARRALALTPPQDLVLAQQASCLLELNLLTRFYNSPQQFAQRVGRCYSSVEQLLQSAEEVEEDGKNNIGQRDTLTPPLREAVTRLALQPAFVQTCSSSALLRCCCQCFLDESRRVEFLEKHAGRQRTAAVNTMYACLLSLYSSLHISYDLLASLPAERLSALFAALFREAMFYVAHAFRAQSTEGLQRTSHCLEVMAEVLHAGGGDASGGKDVDGGAVRREILQCAFSTALLKCCGKIIDAVAASLRQNNSAEPTLLRCLQLSPVGALLASFSVSLPLLPTSALEACASHLQRCRESLLVLMDQFPSEEAKRWASRLCVAITYSLAQLGCALLDPRPTAQQVAAARHTALLNASSSSDVAQPAYLSLLRNGQRKSNTERDTFIKNLQGGVGAISKAFDELQRKDVSALRVVRDEELREMERQVMAACCALLLPTSAMRDASKENLQPAFQLVLKLRPWVLSKRQESKAYVATVRERAVFLALFEPIADMEEDDVAAAVHPSAAAGSAASAKRTAIATADPRAARAAERKRWQKLYKSWKAMRQLKALMASREDMADMNASAEVMACFQSEVSTEEMKTAVSWRSEKARYRFVGLQLLWELTEEACRSVLLARVLHPVIARALCGWHYADGVDGCSVEQLTRLQSAFFHLMRAAVKAYTLVQETQPWGLLLSSLLSCPFRRTDFRRLRTVGVSADLLRCLWGAEESREVLYQCVNGDVPAELRTTKLRPEGCASTMTVGAAGLTLRSSGFRGSCVAPCTWTAPQRREKARALSYYYEVHVVDVYQGGYVSIGLGPADYSLSQMPGWDSDSFAYDGFEGSIYANRSPHVIGSTFGMGDVVGCGWNIDTEKLFWTRNGKLVHSLKTTPATTQLCPLIGMKGKGCVLVNFGASPFAYQAWGSPVSTPATSQRVLLTNALDAAGVVRDGWDAFRLLSTRAATTLAAACTQRPEVSTTSLIELAQPVGSCIDALVAALAPASAAPLSQCTLPARFVTTLLGHLTLLCKLLRGVPDGVSAPHTSALATLLETMTRRWLLTTLRAAPFNEDESEAVTALLTTWYHAMYLTPPPPVPAPTPSAAAKEAPSNTASPPHSFLDILLQLASCVLTSQDTRMSASGTRHEPETNSSVSAVTSCDTVHWLALALLQRLNNDQDERGCHAWREVLQQWLHTAFKKCTPNISTCGGKAAAVVASPSRDALLGLAVLGGLPRLAVPEDTVMAVLGTHLVSPVTLLRTLWSEEICEVLEVNASDTTASTNAALNLSGASTSSSSAYAVKRLPLRFVHVTVQGDAPGALTFPLKGNPSHVSLVDAVVQLAQQWFPLVSSLAAARVGEDMCCLVAQLSCLLLRCVERRVIVFPPKLTPSLSAVIGMTEEAAPPDMNEVQLELVLSLWGLLQYRQRRGLSRGVNSAQADRSGTNEGVERPVSSSVLGRGLVRVGSATTPEFTATSLRLRTFAALDLLQQRELTDGPAEPTMEYDDNDADAEEEDTNGDEDEAEMDTMRAYGQQQQRRVSSGNDDDGEDEEEDSEDNDGAGAARGAAHQIGAAVGAITSMARYQSQLSASSSSDSFLHPAEREVFDTVHFNGGCVRVRGNTAVGLSFTVDVTLRLTNKERHQILFAQILRGSPTATSPSSSPSSSDVLELVARVVHSNIEFGWLPCFPGEEAQCDPADPSSFCAFALAEEDLRAWMHVTFVQSGTTLSLFRNGMLMDTRTMKNGGGPLFQEEFRLGGVPGQLDSTAFIGDMRNFHVYELALRPAMVEQLHRLNSSLSTFLDAHVALSLKATRSGVENTSRPLAALVLGITAEGDVVYLDESGVAAAQRRQVRQTCAQEVDFSAESEEAEMRCLSEPLPSQQSVLWRRTRGLPRDQLLTACSGYYRQLAAFHGAHLLVHALCNVAKSPDRLPSPVLQSVVETLTDGACVDRLVRWAVSASNETMSTLLGEVWASLCDNGGGGQQGKRPNAGALWEMGDSLLAELLRIAQQPQHLFTFESAHPQRPFASDVYEVNVPDQRSYGVFMDERSVARWRLVTVSRDRTMSTVLSEFYTTMLSSFEVRLPKFFVTVRSAAEAANWGHRMTVVHDYQLQLRAMRLFRSALSAVLSVPNTAATPTAYIWSVNCLTALCAVAQRNTSKTRLLALTCLNDLFLFGQRYDTVPPPLAMPQLMHNMRRMAVRHYRRRLSTQRVLGRFIQLSMESHVMQRDAAQCWYTLHDPKTHGGSSSNGVRCLGTVPASEATSALERQASAPRGAPAGVSADAAVVVAATDADAETTRFAQQRQEQQQLYRQRDSSEDRVSIQKLRVSPNFEHMWLPEGLCVLRGDGAGGSVIAAAPLTAGRWYFEARVGGAGSISIGVLPILVPAGEEYEMPFPLTRATLQDREPVAFNGCSGVFNDGAGQRCLFASDALPLWCNKDFLGVVVDVPAQRCIILVNGVEAVHFSFGAEAANENAAAVTSFGDVASSSFGQSPLMGEFDGLRVLNSVGASAGRASSTFPTPASVAGRRETARSVVYYPYVSIDLATSVSLNFGAAYFEYEVPVGCLPLDPTNLSLGTVFPYNQMRSLQDIAAYLFTGGRYPLPPFYYEEADPFAGSIERVGPAHVSVHASANVQVNMEEVKNMGLAFETVMGDCAVSAGAWYYEVTLRTQGVLQIGWMEKGETLHGNGHGVGDSSTSWAVDLFRRVMWHRGVPEPVNIPRRWTAGDVLGCAFDITHGELSFFLNGRPITGVLALKADSPLLEACTFQGVPQGRYYVPAVSLRSGSAISFNFGSSPFKYKPDGFNPLGVPDSWNERMDAFYNNAPAASTMRRLMAMQEVWRVLSHAHRTLDLAAGAGAAEGRVSSPAASTSHSMDDLEAHLKPYRLIVHATDKFSDDGMNAFTKSSEEQLKNHLMNYSYPETTVTEAKAIAEQSWEMFKVLKAVSNVTNALLPFLSLNIPHPSLMTLLFLTIRTLLFSAVRRDLVESVLAVSSLRSELYRISINRAKAHADTQSVKASVFGQTFALLGSQPPRIFQTRQRFWNTVFLGEGAEDAGGPFREHLSEMCRELMSTRLPFFVPTANHVHNTGSYREAFVPAASACTPYDLEAFVFIGRLMGGAFRSEDPLDLFLPPLVWRYLCAYPITETEVEQVDAICVQCVREFRKLAASPGGAPAEEEEGGGDEGSAAELFEDVFGEEYFVTQLSDHSTKELVEGGAQVRVTLRRSYEYAEALLHARVHEFDVPLRKLREGLLSVVPEVAVLLLTPAELERRICGQADYKPEELRKGAFYEGLTSEDRRVQLLWKALDAATPLQRRLFLRFVSGRDRLPIKLRVLPLTTQADPDTMLPRAATCFFAIELPDYSSLDVMKQKLFYSVENCADMDTDFNARIVDQDEAPQLSVALEDAQPHFMTQLNSDED